MHPRPAAALALAGRVVIATALTVACGVTLLSPGGGSLPSGGRDTGTTRDGATAARR